MVKTRHTADVGEESPVTFISLNERKTGRAKANRQNDAEDSDDSGVVNFKQKKLLARKVETVSPELKRSTRTAARRVTYVEDSLDEESETEDEAARHKTKKAQHRTIIKEDGSETEEEGSRRSTKRDKSRATVKVDDSDEDDVKDVADGNVSAEEVSDRAHKGRGDLKTSVPEHNSSDHPAQRSTDYLVAHPSPRQCQIEELADLEDRGIRRSSRTRKLTYHTFDQKVLERCYEFKQPPRKRCRMQAEENNTESTGDGYTDIYSRVKRQRKTVKRDMYGMPVETEGEEENEDEDDENDDTSEDDDNDDDESEEDDEEEDDDEKADQKARGYNLRENKPRTQLYNAPIQEKRPRNQSRFFNDEVSTPHSPARRRRPKKLSYMSPARRRLSGNRRKRAFHGSSSTSSSSSDTSSSDEEKFQRRKAKSMLKARQRCLPMNFDPDDIARSTVLRDRQKIGSSLADIDPMTIDRSITFESIGGLGKHIRALKEMVVFPLLYPEVFERFKITPPRGVLFYGPPGTGKTLVARALANECSTKDRRVAFYMRKGADCLSKWVGESERQLRLLFDQAYQTRPSIIFFDEIDGLAPVRSSRQDQIHSSIVSTLLALMDGLDSRGEIVVIGATNRLDSIDPALRRPGRFDREFLFPLPSIHARSQILKIHTKDWNPKLCDMFVEEVAKKCIGYCGADMKALCTEVALLALRRRYPQIYTSSEKLQIDVTSINVNAKDFHNAMISIIPASQRSVVTPARALTVQIKPLLQTMFTEILLILGNIFPFVLMQLGNLDMSATENAAENALMDMDLCSDEEDNDGIFEQKINKRRKSSLIPPVRDNFLDFASYANRNPTTHRPRLLLTGTCDQGQTSHLAPAMIHHLEQLPVHTLDLSSLYAVNARMPEESCAHIFREARRTAPSIIYFPHINQWWPVVGETVRSAVMTFIQDFEPGSPVLLLATSEEEYTELDCTLQDLFDVYSGEVFVMRNPNKEERHNFFKDLLLHQATIPPPKKKSAAQRLLEILPKAPPPEPRKLTDQEVKKLNEVEEATLTELRLFLRDVLNKLGRDRKFFIFTKPVDIEEVPDYYAIIRKPMDLSTMMSKIDLHLYQSVKEFLEDIEQICLNALEYNPDKDQQSRVIRHRACALKDTAYAIIKTELDPEFEKICESIVESRKHRGEESSKSAPAFYHTKPIGSSFPLNKNYTPSYKDPHVRTSRRLQGANAFDVPSLEQVERSARTLRSLKKMSPVKENDNLAPHNDVTKIPLISNDFRESQDSVSRKKISKLSSSSKTPTSSKKRKDVWGPSTYRSYRRKRKLKQHISSEEDNLQEEQVMSAREDSEGENKTEIVESKGASVVENGRSIQPVSVASSRQDSIDEKSTQENLSGRSAPVDSLLVCLSVDVNMKSPKDDSRSPYRCSPRTEFQKSPNAVMSKSHNHSPTRLSKLNTGHCLARGHALENKSPRSHDNTASLVMEVSDKCPVINNKLTKCYSIGSTNRDSFELSAPIITQDSLNAPQEVDQVKLKNNVVQMLVNDCVDSGVGSSESNGDSNDSQLIAVLGNCDSTAGQGTTKLQDVAVTNLENLGKCAEKQEKEGIPLVFHHTRSQNHTKTLEKASEPMQELREPVIVDRERLLGLLEKTVLLTENYTVPRLEKLYCLMAQCIYRFREDFIKNSMIEELEKRLKQYTMGITKKLRIEETKALTSH